MKNEKETVLKTNEGRVKTDNELIAEFMGATIYKEEYGGSGAMNRTWNIKTNIGDQVLWGYEMKYSASWDWLIPVVEKIKENYDVSIRFFDGECACYINKQSVEGFEICSYGNFEPSIVNVYKAVVEFIKWYNERGVSF